MFPSRVFISYRRDDLAKEALQLYGQLTEMLDPAAGQVFFDNQTMPPSSELEWSMTFSVRFCRLAVVLIGPHWHQELQSRLQRDDTDWVVHEIATAFRYHVPVLPVLFDGTRLPAKAALPEEIRKLGDIKYLECDRQRLRERVLARKVIELLERQPRSESPPRLSDHEDEEWIGRICASLRRCRDDPRYLADALDHACSYLDHREIDALVECLRDHPHDARITVDGFFDNEKLFQNFTNSLNAVARRIQEDRDEMLRAVERLRRDIRGIRSQPDLIDAFVSAWEALKEMVCNRSAKFGDVSAISRVCSNLEFCLVGARLISTERSRDADKPQSVLIADSNIAAEMIIHAVHDLCE